LRGDPRGSPPTTRTSAEKFATPVPPDLAATIEAQADAEVLAHWLTLALGAGSLEAFRDATAR
jgi:hypothetical protein